MKLREVQRILGASLCSGREVLEWEVGSAYAGDLMSIVLSGVEDEQLLITSLVSPQTVHTAEVMGMTAIVFLCRAAPDPAVLRSAQTRGIAVLYAPKCMYEACALLHANGLK